MGIRRSNLGRGDIARDANWLRPFLPAVGGDTYRVRVSADDTTPDYLDAKIISTDGSVVINPLNDGADEDLDLSVAVYVADALDDHTADADAHHNWPLLDADIPSTIARDSEVTSAISTHASDANAHHNRSHAITSSSDHTVTGAALDVVGLTATNTLGILTPSAAVSSAVSALLKSDSNGRLQVQGLGIGTAAAGNALYVNSNINLVGDRSIVAGDVSISMNDTVDIISADVVSLRVRRYSDTRYSLNITPTSTEVTLTSYDNTGAVNRPMVYAASSHTFTGGNINLVGNRSIVEGDNAIGINDTANIIFADTASFRVRRYDANRYRLGINPTSTGVTLSAYDDTGAVALPMAYTASNHAFSGGDVTVATSGDQGNRFLMTNSDVSGGTVFYDFNDTDRDAGGTGAFEAGFYRDANNITQFRMSKEVFEIIIKSGGTFRFPLEVRAQQVILAELPTSNPGIIGALYRSGNDVLIST